MSRRPIAAERALLALGGFSTEYKSHRAVGPGGVFLDTRAFIIDVSPYRSVRIDVVLVPPNGAERAVRHQYVATVETRTKRHPWQSTVFRERRTVRGPLQTSVIERECAAEARLFAIDTAAQHLAYHRSRWAIADARRTVPTHLGRLTEHDLSLAIRERVARRAAQKARLFARSGRFSSSPQLQRLPAPATTTGTAVHNFLAQARSAMHVDYAALEQEMIARNAQLVGGASVFAEIA